MKYKIGDKVRIKKYIAGCCNSTVREILKNNNYILTISELLPGKNWRGYYSYYVEEINFAWSEDIIECLYVEKIYKPIHSRFEILDIRE